MRSEKRLSLWCNCIFLPIWEGGLRLNLGYFGAWAPAQGETEERAKGPNSVLTTGGFRAKLRYRR